MQLPEFLFAVNNNMDGAGYVLQTIPPFMVAKVYKIRPAEVDNFKGMIERKINNKIEGYSIFLFYEGCLTEDHSADQMETERILKTMCKFYYNDKIESKQAEFKRYREA